MNFFQNQYLIENLSNVASSGFVAFLIAFLVTPLVGRLADFLGAVDIPARLRKRTDSTASRRIHVDPTPKLGGLAMVIAILVALLLADSFQFIPKGVLLGAIIIIVLGILDDIFEMDGKVQLIFQLAAAAAVVVSGISITSVHLVGNVISFNIFSAVIEVLSFSYNFIFPADIITLLWIVGMINVINWVGGVDALNGSVSSIAAVTILLLVLASGNIPLSIIIAIHTGSILGVLPYNYNPAKIYYGSIGDYLNGYLLAIFAIIGSTRWTATIILLGMPIVDGILVFLIRLRDHPELRKQPWKILSVSDNNHLHHRLLAAGYSRKMVTLVEVAIMSVLCAIAIVFSDIRTDVMAFVIGAIILFVSFAIVFFLKKRNEKAQRLLLIQRQALEEEERNRKEAVVTTIYEEEDEDKKFIY